MLADTPWPRGFGAALASVDTFSKGSRTVRRLPALPCRLRAICCAALLAVRTEASGFSVMGNQHCRRREQIAN
jgi:hypothetical protein